MPHTAVAHGVGRVCCCVSAGQAISIDSAVLPGAAAARRSAAKQWRFHAGAGGA